VRLVVNGQLEARNVSGEQAPPIIIDVPITLSTGGEILAYRDIELRNGLRSEGGKILNALIGPTAALNAFTSEFMGETSLTGEVKFQGGSNHFIKILPGGKLITDGNTLFTGNIIEMTGQIVPGRIQNDMFLDLEGVTLTGTLINNDWLTIRESSPITLKNGGIIRTTTDSHLTLKANILSVGEGNRVEIIDGEVNVEGQIEIEAFYDQKGGEIDNKLTLLGGGSFSSGNGGTIEIEELHLNSGTYSIEGIEFTGSFSGSDSKLFINTGATVEIKSENVVFDLGIFDIGDDESNLAELTGEPSGGLILDGGVIQGTHPFVSNQLLLWRKGSFNIPSFGGDGSLVAVGDTQKSINFDITDSYNIMLFPDVSVEAGILIETDELILGGKITGGQNSVVTTSRIRSLPNSEVSVDIDLIFRGSLSVSNNSTLAIHGDVFEDTLATEKPFVIDGELSNVFFEIGDQGTLIIPNSNSINRLKSASILIDGGFFPGFDTRDNLILTEKSSLSFKNEILRSYETLDLRGSSSLLLSNTSFEANQILVEDNTNSKIVISENSTATIGGDLIVTGIRDFLTLNSSSLVINGNMDIDGDLPIRGGYRLAEPSLVSRDSILTVENLNLTDARAIVSGITGSTVRTKGDLDVGRRSRLSIDKNSLLIVDGEFEVSGITTGNDGATVVILGTANVGNLDVNWGGTLTGSGTVNGLLIKNNGLVAPGSSPGILTLNADYEQSATGVLEIEVAGTVPGDEHDQLLVNGNASLAGTLLVFNSGDYDWQSSTAIPVIQANSYTGMFDRVIVGGGSSRRTANLDIAGETLSVSTGSTTYLNFGDWRNAQFTAADLLDETISGPLSDPDNDGTGNFLEYVFDFVPQFTDAQEPIFDIQLNEAEDKLLIEVIFPWAKGMTDVEYTLQTSHDLETWTDLESTLTNTEPGEFAEMLTVEAEMDTTGNIPIYARLLVKEIEL
jgi:hypothetical protein